MKSKKSALIVTILLFILHHAIAQIIPNSSFEKGEKSLPSGWKFETWDKGIISEWSESGHNSKKSLAISGTEKGWARWMCKIPLNPYSLYRFTGWIKTESISGENSGGAAFSIGNLDIQGIQAITGTNNWHKVTFEFETKGDDSGVLECILGFGGASSGKAWFDDLKLELISSRKLDPNVTIDVNKPKVPVSKYIYGQFIEHLGRCIYRGIWSEIIEDRKFYYIPGSKESAWKITGEAACLKMAETPYVGKNTPEFITSGSQSCGIEQENIPLIKEMEYTGRIIVSGKAGSKLILSLKWGELENEKQIVEIGNLTEPFQKIPLKFKAGATTEKGILTIKTLGSADVIIGAISLMPANNIEGFRADVIALLKELNSPVYRWPGGNFVSGYNWKDGIGDPDRRPPRKNPAWTGIEHNDVGIDEFMKFCHILNTEPYIALNSGLGGVVLATEEVEYCNGAIGTTMGHLRADNGHPEPYNVKFWAVGNEMYGDWQLGNMPVETYVKKHIEFADAIWKVDSTAQLIAVGSIGDWDKMMLGNCANQMNYISEHIYRQDWHGGGLMTHTRQLADDIRNIAKMHRKYRDEIPELKGKDIRIAMDEWNYWYGPHIFGELGTRYFWKDGLGIAAGLHEFFRNSDMYFMANYAQTVNVIGCIKTTGTSSSFETTGLVLKMYRQYFGEIPVTISGTPEPLDVIAALTADKKYLTLAVMNPTRKKHFLKYSTGEVKFERLVEHVYIQNDNELAFNDPGKTPEVSIKKDNISINGNFDVAPLSVNIYRLKVAD